MPASASPAPSAIICLIESIVFQGAKADASLGVGVTKFITENYAPCSQGRARDWPMGGSAAENFRSPPFRALRHTTYQIDAALDSAQASPALMHYSLLLRAEGIL